MSDLIAGTLAGFAICAVGHPFDTIKVLMQSDPVKFSSVVPAVKEVISKNGLGGLYSGVASPLIGAGFYNAVQFAVFASAKRVATEDGRQDTLSRIAAAAAFTGVFVALVEGPQDLVKSQLQADMMRGSSGVAPLYTGTADCARKIWASAGLRGVAQGLEATIARNIVGVSAYFCFYEAVRRQMAAGGDVSKLASWQVLIAGGCGGIGYWTMCYPLDIIKSAIQTDSINAAEKRYRGGFLHTAQKLWAEGGVKRYTAGLAPCLMRSFPANAAGFVVFEASKSAILERWK